MSEDRRRFAPATGRNREPILAVLRRHLPPRAHVLEIASGSGEHAIFLAPALEVARWQPTDPDPDALASIDAWRAHEGERAPAIRPAVLVDVTQAWPAFEGPPFDALFCANMIHIAPFAACEGLLAGAGAILAPGKHLFLYGPFRRHGAHTAPSNAAFDENLRARDPRWGVRDLEKVSEIADKHGLVTVEIAEMPANNLTVVFTRR